MCLDRTVGQAGLTQWQSLFTYIVHWRSESSAVGIYYIVLSVCFFLVQLCDVSGTVVLFSLWPLLYVHAVCKRRTVCNFFAPVTLMSVICKLGECNLRKPGTGCACTCANVHTSRVFGMSHCTDAVFRCVDVGTSSDGRLLCLAERATLTSLTSPWLTSWNWLPVSEPCRLLFCLGNKLLFHGNARTEMLPRHLSPCASLLIIC